MAHKLRAGLRAEERAQGVNDYGLARAGFSRQRVEARAEPQVEAIYDGKIGYVQLGKHGFAGVRC